jgi:hypothetical protein
VRELILAMCGIFIICLTWFICFVIFPNSSNSKIDINRCYVPMGNKYSIFTEKDYKMNIHKNGVLFIYRKSDNHLMLITSSFTGVCDDSIDPNMTAKPEKE